MHRSAPIAKLVPELGDEVAYYADEGDEGHRGPFRMRSNPSGNHEEIFRREKAARIEEREGRPPAGPPQDKEPQPGCASERT